jgi:hypothetical protein
MTRLKIAAAAFVLAAMGSLASGQVFSENFDSYASGAALHGRGGWKGWDNARGAGAPTSSRYAYSGANSVEVIGTADLVHEFDLVGGRYEVSAMQYIPEGATGNTYFILLNRYADFASDNDWSIQLNFDLDTGVVAAELMGEGLIADIVYGRWVQLRFRVDLVRNTCEWHYAGVLIGSQEWDDNAHGTLGAIDLFGNGASSVYYDDITITQYYLYKADSPSPADGAAGVASAELSWLPGDTAAYHNVYLGTSAGLTDADLVAGMATGLTYTPATGFQPGVTYYWRVDEVEADGATIHTGDVWSFTTLSGDAYSPVPADGREGIAQAVTLSWRPGLNAKEHHVYFGDDPDAVASGDDAADKGITSETSFHTGLLRAGTAYSWRVDEIDGNDVQIGKVWTFTTAQPAVGKIVREWWTGLPGVAVSDLTASERYPNVPTGRELVDRFEGPVNWKDSYAARLYGWLKPEKSGSYRFWIASNEQSELWLSADADPANAVRIARVTGWSNPRDFNNASRYAGSDQESTPVVLEAGRKYYIQAVMKEGSGEDHVAVAWQPPAEARVVIPARFVDTFAIPPLRAADPQPQDGAVDVVQSLVLRWFAGENALEHDVYFGDDAAAVAAADTNSVLYRGRQGGTEFDAGMLEWNTTYYWRVDEIAEGDPNDPQKGTLWSFATADFLLIDDFEGYTEDIDAEETLFQGWIDGLTNGTGSYVGYPIAVGGTYGETSVVHSGRQSMPLAYDNTNEPYYSEVERVWATDQDWTVDGVGALSLFIHGKPANDPVSLHVALTDGNGAAAAVEYPDDSVVFSPDWVRWQIPLDSFAGIDPTRIRGLVIGVGSRSDSTPGGSGTIYIDDIRVIRP